MRKDIFGFDEDMRRLVRLFERAFSGFFEDDLSESEELVPVSSGRELENYRKPLADIWETNKEVIVNVELPGVDKKDIDVRVDNGYLEIKVEHKEEDKKGDKEMLRYERRYSGFFRRFKLPENVDEGNVKASYKNGVLEIKIPKIEIKKSGKKINVE